MRGDIPTSYYRWMDTAIFAFDLSDTSISNRHKAFWTWKLPAEHEHEAVGGIRPAYQVIND